jgi:RimJ/RimL family protein N-acetyltransferase/ligand-binding SRPBCC domain-containing protein
MSAVRRFEVSSGLSAPAEAVWEHATTPAGVNFELRPLVRMTFPRRLSHLEPAAVDLGRRMGRCWVLLFGVLPVDWDDLTFVEFEPGRRFLERSPMLTQRVWEHERLVVPEGGGARLIDRVRFASRLATLGALQAPVFERVFRHRHRRVRRRFGRRPMTFRLETERLVIAPWPSSDLAVLRRLAADPRVMRYIGDGSPWTEEQVQVFLERQERGLADEGFCLGAVTQRATGEVVGLSGMQRLGTTGEVEIGWWLAPERWRQGLATEAGAAVMRYAFDTLGFRRVTAIADPDNEASLRVMQRLGMTELGLATGRELGLRHPEAIVVLYAGNQPSG